MIERTSPPRWPPYVIGAVGVILTILVLVWAGSTYDDHGNPLLDDDVVKVLVPSIGGAVTVMVALAERVASRTMHELRPNHGSSLVDKVNGVAEVQTGQADDLKAVQHSLHEIQAAIARLISLPSEIKGLREDVRVQATTDQQTHEDVAQLRKEFAVHVTDADVRLKALEGKKES